MLITSGAVRSLGSPEPTLTLGREWEGPRWLTLDDQPAFDLSNWCGTCRFLFRRMEGAKRTVSIAALEQRLSLGLGDIDGEVVEAFAALLPRADYLPLLMQVQPRLTWPSADGDYFAHEQVSTWGVPRFWGLPENPRTPYYRTFETPVSEDEHLFEFVVPMVPPSWNDAGKVAEHAQRLGPSSRPTAVAIATLDVGQPGMDEQATDYYAHWCLTHFLLDGHHKMQAAADTNRPLRLLSLLAVDGSRADAAEIARLPALRGQAFGRRQTNPEPKETQSWS